MELKTNILSYISRIDKDYKGLVVFPDYKMYDKILMILGDNIAVTNNKKLIIIDGGSIENITMDHIYAIEAHEIAHHHLKHEFKLDEEQEKEADYGAYVLLNDLGLHSAADIIKDDFIHRQGEEFNDFENRSGRAIKSKLTKKASLTF